MKNMNENHIPYEWDFETFTLEGTWENENLASTWEGEI
jgi:hypothetical protein